MCIPGASPTHFRSTLFIAAMVLGLSVALSSLAGATHAAAQPELPRVFLDTTYVPPTGQTITVGAGGNLQAAINAAAPGDVITLQAGATFTGNYVLPYKSGSGWITIRSSAPDSSLPPLGIRVTPAYANQLPKLISPNSSPALSTAPRAHHYRLIGIEFGLTASLNYCLVQLGSSSETSVDQLSNNLILDRCYVHGNDTGQVQNGIRLNSASTAIIDSYISNLHAVDWECHGIVGYHGSGPFKLVNNFIEASSINLLFGGTVPRIANLIPSDIEVRRNHFFKRLSWKPDDPSYAGTPWVCKNLFELKIAQRVLIDGNVFEHNWPSEPTADGGPQHGWAILFTVRDEDGAAPWAVVQDVSFTNNLVRHSNCGFQLYGAEGQGMQRIKIANNLLADIGPNWGNNDKTGRAIQVSDTTDLIFDHNTMLQTAAILWVYGSAAGGFTFTNNLTPHNAEGVDGDGTSSGLNTLNSYFPGYVFQKNAIVGGSASAYPANNFFPATLDHVGFVNRANGNYRLASTSPYKHAGTDGKDLGADFDAIDAAGSGGSGGGGGNTAPTVSLTSPANNATFTAPASIGLVASASDSDGTISRVEFFAGTTLLGTELYSPYNITWSSVPAGTYTLTAKATDNAGATTTSSPITVIVNAGGNAAPAVSLTSPANNATFTAPASINLVASASDSDGTISRVEFFAGTTLLGTELYSPYNITWSSVPAGTYTLTAKARDNLGKTSTSSPITVKVNSGAPAPPTAPSNLAATSPASGRIDLTWSDNSTGETGFKIERSTDGVNFTQIAKVGRGVTKYSNTGLTPGKFYWYRVRAYLDALNSAYSNTVRAQARQ
jgi:hypothetical protein